MSAVLDTTDVYLGHWVNWSLGTVQGSTITLTRRDGALLTAFLAIFVSFAGIRIWKIMALTIFLSIAQNNTPQDALFHQRQAILRNSSTADDAFWSLLKVVWAWRKSNRFVYRKIGPLALVSLVAGLAFAVAGVFSSRVSSSQTGSEVLLSGHGCAWINSSSWNAQETTTILQSYNSELIQDASQREEQCYTSNTSATSSASAASTENCQTFIKPSISTSVTRNASCPFDQKICQSNTANLVIDTGYLDSHNDFGVNAPREKRITSRFMIHCAPLVLEGYSGIKEGPTNSNNTLVQSESKQRWMQYFYGSTPIQPPHNFTYQYPIIVLENASDITTSTGFEKDYTVDARGANANNSGPQNANFITIPELTRTDADTILVFLSPNFVAFSSPVDDPWYSAHQGPFSYQVAGGDGGSGTTHSWFADNPANVLGCTEQLQFCNPSLPLQQSCGPLTSPSVYYEQLTPNVPPISPPWRDQTEAARFRGFLNTWSSFSFYPDVIIGSLRSKALASRNNFLNGFQGALTSNQQQWQLDVESWFSTQLATLQRAFAETANGPRYPGIESHLWPPQNNLDREFCTNQKILNTNYTSFSTLGLVITFLVGGIFIIASYFLEPVLYWIQRRWRLDNMTEWWINETLQLQSFVHEEVGAGEWVRQIGIVPTTISPGERLATLDLMDPGHPRFKASHPTLDKSLAAGCAEDKAGAVSMMEDVSSNSRASLARDGVDDTKLAAPADGHYQDVALDTSRHDHEHHDDDGVAALSHGDNH